MRFRAELLQNGKTATGFVVPDEVVEALGAGRRPPVRVTIAGHTYRSSIAIMRGRFMLGVSAENRDAAGVAAGEVLEVEVVLDEEPRTIVAPDDLAGALHGAGLSAAFAELSYSKQRWLVENIDRAKQPKTRQRRIDNAIAFLRG